MSRAARFGLPNPSSSRKTWAGRGGPPTFSRRSLVKLIEQRPRLGDCEYVALLLVRHDRALEGVGGLLVTTRETQDLGEVDERVAARVEEVALLRICDRFPGEGFGRHEVAAPREDLRLCAPRHDVRVHVVRLRRLLRFQGECLGLVVSLLRVDSLCE